MNFSEALDCLAMGLICLNLVCCLVAIVWFVLCKA